MRARDDGLGQRIPPLRLDVIQIEFPEQRDQLV